MEDPWQPDRRRQHSNKRNFELMATEAFRNSPSPQLFGDSISSRVSPSIFLPSPQRRLSHPHNAVLPRHRATPTMSQRPNLEHRTSQTIIDLTDDADDIRIPTAPGHAMQRPAGPSRVNTPPSGAAVIDLTDDDIQIVGEAELPQAPRSRANPRHRHHNNPIHALIHEAGPPRADSPLFVPEHAPARLPYVGRIMASIGGFGRLNILYNGARDNNADDLEEPIFHHMIRLPEQMNYAGRAFPQVPADKPEHIPPNPAVEGFTTSPQEDQIIICPACEQELITNQAGEPYARGKGKTKKDRAEHPFWVVKSCGHTYCNNCFQNRKHNKNNFIPAFFPNGTMDPSGGKTRVKPVCAVEGCRGAIDSPTAWVGIFL